MYQLVTQVSDQIFIDFGSLHDPQVGVKLAKVRTKIAQVGARIEATCDPNLRFQGMFKFVSLFESIFAPFCMVFGSLGMFI